MLLPQASLSTKRTTQRLRASFAFSRALGLAFLALPLATLALTERPAYAAEPAARKVIAIYTEGPDAAAIRADLESIIPERVVVATAKEFAAALKKSGQTRAMGQTLTDAKQRSKVMPRLQQAASLIGANAVLVGIVQNVKGQDQIYLLWINADNDENPVDQAVAIPDTEAKWHQALSTAIDPALEKLAPKEEPKPVDTTPKDEKKDGPEGGPRPRHLAGSAFASIELGFEAGGRWFSYSDGLSAGLRTYGVPFAPMLSIAGEIYPAAGTSIPVLRDLGITLSFARAFGLASATDGGDLMKTVYQRIGGALRYRLPFQRPTGPILGISAGVLWQKFHIEELPEVAGQTANVDYLALRFGVDGRYPIGRIGLVAGFDYLEPLSAGEVYERFTNPKVHGIGAMGGVFVGVATGFEVRVAGEYRRFFSDFDPKLGDTYIAGGALDQYMGIRLSGAYVE